MCRYPALTAA
uniref:Pco147797a n=1 Tax=Arundo donax TaxID=35708 RepID=A0A0A9CBP4_ARUDO